MKLPRINSRMVTGIAAIVLGIIFLGDNFNWAGGMWTFNKLWPVMIIIGGFYVIADKQDKDDEAE